MATRLGDHSATVASDLPVTTAVVEAVSSTSGTPEFDLPPVYDAIDPDALDALFDGRGTSGHVTFRYAGYEVTVHADRPIEVATADRPER